MPAQRDGKAPAHSVADLSDWLGDRGLRHRGSDGDEKSLHAHSKRLLREGGCRADERLVGLTRIVLAPIPPPSGKKPRKTMLPDAIETDSPILSRALEQN
ncbi:MAG: hypothetical protein SPK06_00975 [Kiritimatiellia bacterium]|nr:hypothetical protein [Kiritimatiellia bacterium]